MTSCKTPWLGDPDGDREEELPKVAAGELGEIIAANDSWDEKVKEDIQRWKEEAENSCRGNDGMDSGRASNFEDERGGPQCSGTAGSGHSCGRL